MRYYDTANLRSWACPEERRTRKRIDRYLECLPTTILADIWTRLEIYLVAETPPEYEGEGRFRRDIEVAKTLSR